MIKDSTGFGNVPYLFTQSVANSVNSLLFEHSVADLYASSFSSLFNIHVAGINAFIGRSI